MATESLKLNSTDAAEVIEGVETSVTLLPASVMVDVLIRLNTGCYYLRGVLYLSQRPAIVSGSARLFRNQL